MIDNLTKAQIAGILEALPIDITFIDENDKVKFWNKDKTRVIKRPASALGENVRECHPPDKIAEFDQLISDFKSGRRDCLEYEIKIQGRTIKIRNASVRDNSGKYLGAMEVDQDITDLS